MKVNDAILGLILLTLAVAVGFEVRSYPDIPGQNVGPGAFPGLLAVLLAVCGVLLVIKGLRNPVKRPWWEPAPWMRSPRHLLAFGITIGSMVLAIFAFEPLGFIVCAFIILLAMFSVLRVRPLVALPVAVGVSLGVHTMFYFGLRVPLPWGLLQPVAW